MRALATSLLGATALSAVPAASLAQSHQPAALTITPLTMPEVVQVLDGSGTWVQMGTVDPVHHTFTALNTVQVNTRPVINATQAPYNADPTGGADSTAGINAALAATGMCVYLPAGNYYVTDALLAPANSTCIFGDGPTATTIWAYNTQSGKTNFNLSAAGVVVLSASGGNGALVRDIGFDFRQPQTSTRANIVPFPPAIKIKDSGRPRIQNVRVSDANVCLDARSSTAPGMGGPGDYSTSSGGGAFIDNLECGALTAGMLWAGALDFVHWKGFHFWNFGSQLQTGGLNTIFSDGQTMCFQNGRIDGLLAEDIACFKGNAIETVNANDSTNLNAGFMNLQLDNNAALSVAGGNIYVVSGHSSPNTNATLPTIGVSGGVLRLSKWILSGGQNDAVTQIQVSGSGKAYITDTQLTMNNPTFQLATVTGGFLQLSGNTIFSSQPRTTPLVEQSGTGYLQFFDNTMYSPANGVAVQYDTDTGLNYYGFNTINGWGVNYPPTVVNGKYRSVLGGWEGPSWTLNNPAGTTNIFFNSADGSPSFLSVQDAGVVKWRVGNMGAANGDYFSVRDVVGGVATDALTIHTGGAVAFGEAANNVHAFRGILQAYSGDTPTITATGGCTIGNKLGGQTGGSFRATNTSCAATAITLAFTAAAAAGFTCEAHDQQAQVDLHQASSTPTSVTFNGSPANGDNIAWKCMGW